MKKSIALLIGIALILLGTLTRGNWIIGLKLLCAIFLVMLVLYWKIAPFKQQLFPKYQKAFGITERIFMRLQNILGCLLYTSDAADDLLCVDLDGSRLTKKKKT